VRQRLGIFVLLGLASLTALAVRADDCPCPQKPAPPPALTGSLGAGYSVTSGNSDTQSLNIVFGLQYDPKTRNVLKVDGLYIRGEAGGTVNIDRTTLGIRDEYSLSDRFFLFGEARYLRDRFKNVTYLITPLVGSGYKVIKTEELTLSFDGAVGGAFEKDTGLSATSSGAFRAGEAFEWKISKSAALTQSAYALWKANDTSDSLYHFEVGLTTSLASKLELKLSFLDDYKNKPPNPMIKKNDTAFLATLLYKF
jgi:putative salt-induced outer membrane protein